MKPTIYTIFFLFTIIANVSAQDKILFDASKGQTAGNADWVIDADTHNLGIGSSGAYVGGNESNPQRYPNPLQTAINASTPENYWQGALSYWAIDCVKKGYIVETLPWDGLITYGIASNPQDLSNYKVFIVDEPNIIFTDDEKTAIINFVANGGGLFMISDHDVSDRNGDGFDSPHIWNDLMMNNSLGVNPFGISFDYLNISGTYTNIANYPTDPILHGTTGNVTKVKYTNGTTMTLNTTQNSSIKGVIFKTGNSGLNNVICAYGTYGSGKIAAIGDSSIPDDGTGDTGDILYDGYITDASGNHQRLLMNITNWLIAPSLSNESFDKNSFNLTAYPNPSQDKQVHLSYYLSSSEDMDINVYDSLGRNAMQLRGSSNLGKNDIIVDTSKLQKGIYICKIAHAANYESVKLIVQ